MSLVPLITKLSLRSGCQEAGRCEEVLNDAVARRASLVEAVYDAGLVDEDTFAKEMAGVAGLEYLPAAELDLSNTLHNRFPAKLALRHRLLPARIDESGICLMTYDPFDLEARQAVGR